MFNTAKKHKFYISDIPVQIYIFIILSALFITGCKEEPIVFEPLIHSKPDNLKITAEQIVLNALSDADPKIRAKAIEVVADTDQKRLMPEVQKLLKDDYIPVRFAAELAIGDMEYFLARNALQQLLKAPDENTQIGAAYGLYKLGYKQYLKLIQNAVTSRDQTVRANAVVLLGKSSDQSNLDLLYWAKDDDHSEPKVRYQSAEAIAKLKDETIIPKLWTMIISKYVDNKIIGIRAMGALGTREAKEVLLTKLDDDIPEVQLAAAEQLAMLGDNSGQDNIIAVFEQKLADSLEREDRERLLVLAALAIGRIDSPETVKYLQRLIEDDSELVRLAAAQAVLLSKNVR